MNFKKGILVASTLLMTLGLCACPGKVSPGDPKGSDYGKASRIWGAPLIRVNTAGFNGYPSQPNDAGPANTENPKKKP